LLALLNRPSELSLEVGKILFDGVADDAQVDIGLAVRDAVASSPDYLPFIAEGLVAKLDAGLGDGLDGRGETKADGICDSFVSEVPSAEVPSKYFDVIEGVANEFLVGSTHSDTASLST
jgi:hypothetical protein